MISCRAACLPKGPPNRVGVGHAGWGGSCRGGCIIQGLGGSCRGGVGHTGVGWVIKGGWGRHERMGWGGSCRGAVGHAVHVGVGWVNNSVSKIHKWI